MSGPDLEQMLQQAKDMQGQLARVQQELARRSVEGSAGGGMVTAKATGDLRILDVTIEPSLIADGDLAMLQDLVAAAVNAAIANAQRMVQEEIQKHAGPMGALLGGLGGSS
ncbi:MAG: YbaB/EbfC family nucleoid-associated protein [Myxococcales bacterium]|nr:YbaB/EbfC family nucleoid-associated protein [Myxococcales bacterium]